MGSQRKPEKIDTILEFRKSAASQAHVAAKAKDVDSTTLAAEVDSLENRDTIAAAITPPVPATPLKHITETNTDEATKSAEVVDRTLFEGNVDEMIGKYAELIEKEPHEINNYPLYRFIDKWYGTKYKWGGTDLEGVDCSGFSQKLYESVYNTTLARTSRQQHKNCERIKDSDDAKEGDLVFFRIHRLRISHVAVYLANGYFVHASRSQGVVISNLNTPYWHRRYASCGKVQRESKRAMESEHTVTPTE